MKYSSLCYTLGACCLFYIWECVCATPTFLTYWDKFILVILSLSYVCLFVTPWTVAHQAPLGFPGKNTRVGCHCLLQGIFPTQGSPALAGRFFTREDSLPLQILYHVAPGSVVGPVSPCPGRRWPSSAVTFPSPPIHTGSRTGGRDSATVEAAVLCIPTVFSPTALWRAISSCFMRQHN